MGKRGKNKLRPDRGPQPQGPRGPGPSTSGPSAAGAPPHRTPSATVTAPAAPAPRPDPLPELRRQIEEQGRKLGELSHQTASVSSEFLTRLDQRLRELRTELQAENEQRPARLARIFEKIDESIEDYEAIATALPTGGRPVLEQRITELEALHTKDAERITALIEQLRQLELALAKRDTEVARLRSEEGRVLREDLEAERRKLAEERAEVADVQRLRTENAILVQQLEELRRADRATEQRVRDVTELERVQARLYELDDENGELKERENRARAQRDAARREVDRLKTELDEQRSALEALEEHRTERDALMARREELERYLREGRKRAEHAERELEDRRHEIDGLRAALRDAQLRLERAVEEARAAVMDDVRAQLEERDRRREADFERDRAWWEQRIAELNAERELAASRIADLRDSLETALRENDAGREQLQHELLDYRAEEQAAILEERGKLEEQVAQLRGALAPLLQEESDARTRTAELRAEVALLTADRQFRKLEIERLEARERELRHIDLPRHHRLESLREPVLPDPRPVGPAVDELAWLESVRGGIERAGFVFPERLVHAFHTSLKTAAISPITILAGISGTGKSELPRLYADLGGLCFLNMAVQPNWDSPDDLFGFFNYTDGRYRATDLARLLYQASGEEAEASMRDHVVLVLLDEMNIARVEYYFAELLSRLETRRNLARDREGWQRGAIRIDAGAGEQDELLFLDHNVLFVGTMNEDESTLALSDKVKDRASMITFPSPRTFHERREVKPVVPREHALARATWESWRRTPDSLGAEQLEILEERGHTFNEALSGVGRAIGHRVFQAIRDYVTQYPHVTDEDLVFERALSDVYALKLLPKLIGVETRAQRGRACLDDVEQHLPDDLRQAFAHSREQDYFTWQGSREVFEGVLGPVPSTTTPERAGS